MNHQVEDLRKLHADANNLLENVVLGTADKIIADLTAGIENLKINWKGSDANKNINDLIKVNNGLIAMRNSLAQLAVDSASVAVDYDRRITANGGESLGISPLSFTAKPLVDAFTGETNLVFIVPSADEGKTKVDAAYNAFEGFKGEVESSRSAIMNNWTVGDETRDNGVRAFETFKQNEDEYQEILRTVSTNITTALQNYM